MGIAAMAALTLVSCSSDDLNSLSDNSSKNEAINFDGYLGRSAVSVNGTRGSELKIDDLKSTDTDKKGFGVFGNYNEKTGTVYGENLFKNQQVYSSSAASPAEWTYSPKKYWSTQGHIDFLAYAPYDANTELNATPDGKKTSSINFTVENTVTKQKDLLWANAEDQTKANNSGTKKVEFTFNHALAKIGYKVKLNNAYSNATITLKKITLAGSADEKKNAFYTAGTIDLSKTSSTELWAISSTDAKQNFKWFSSDKTLNNTGINNSDAEYLFVIPQDFSKKTTGADELYVIVEYTIQTGSTATMTSKVSKSLPYNFQQGKAYMINLTVGLTPIEFDAAVTPWTDANNKNTDIDINTWE